MGRQPPSTRVPRPTSVQSSPPTPDQQGGLLSEPQTRRRPTTDQADRPRRPRRSHNPSPRQPCRPRKPIQGRTSDITSAHGNGPQRPISNNSRSQRRHTVIDYRPAWYQAVTLPFYFSNVILAHHCNRQINHVQTVFTMTIIFALSNNIKYFQSPLFSYN